MERTLIDWTDFFAAQLGASAALAGLLFVGTSINITEIIARPHLANRALQALILLVTILLVSSLGLVPGQSVEELGVEVLILGAVVSAVIARVSVRNVRRVEKEHRSYMVLEAILGHVALAFYVAAGIVMIVVGSEGIYLVVPAFLVSFVNSIEDAWVLLVEINR